MRRVDGRDVACLIGFLGELQAPRWSALEVKGTIYTKKREFLKKQGSLLLIPT
jgi:hypothetical protein